MKAPLTLAQIHPEGGTLAYLIRFHSHQILAFGGMNYIERELVGLEPDVALIGGWCLPKGNLRLQRPPDARPTLSSHRSPDALGQLLVPFEAWQQAALDALQAFIQEIVAASSKTRVIVPKYFEPIPLDTLAK
jgi:hypothetical protein